MTQAIRGFGGTLIGPDDSEYDAHREVWNAMVDRRPALIARCASPDDVAAAIRHARAEGLEIAVKCGGHNVLGFSVPDGGLMIDLSPMSTVTVDPDARRAVVAGGALLRYLDRASQAHGLATTAGNVSHTGVGGLTLGGGMGWLARQAGLACDNVERYTLVTADGELVRATASDEPELYWGLRGGGGNFGVVTEFTFRLHPVAGRAVVVELAFPAADALEPMRRWRDLLPDAPRQATLTADAVTVDGRPVVLIGYVWVGDPDGARAYLPTMRSIGQAADESVVEMSYLELQSIGDARHHHGLRRYANGHYFTELTDPAIEAFLARGVSRLARKPTGHAWRPAASRPMAARSPTWRTRTRHSATATRSSSSSVATRGPIPPRTPIGSSRPAPSEMRSSPSPAVSTSMRWSKMTRRPFVAPTARRSCGGYRR